MESRAKLAGHAIHPMLVVFPLGLLATAFVFDMIYLGTGASRWAVVSYWMIAAGIVGGLLAAPFGWIDWFAIPDGARAKSVGLTHGFGNVAVLVLFAASWYYRMGHESTPGNMAIALGAIGVALACFAGWLGGELVERMGVGVDRGANVNAPSSLSGLPAAATGVTTFEHESERRAA